jgi:pimeloyl-ACP methyl ester carboxylesterase
LRPRVITVHGIWSSGKWQEDVAWYFEPYFDSVIVKYPHYRWLGAFNLLLEPAVWIPALSLILFYRIGLSRHFPSWGYAVVAVLAYVASYARRNRAFAKFLSEAGPYAQPASQSDTHLIAHSFGTYLAGCALRRREDFHVGRVILIGCVLPRTFAWASCRAVGIDDAFRCLRVRNELARQDVVVWIAWAVSWLVLGLGRAGLRGFKGPLTHRVNDPGRMCDSCSGEDTLVHNIVSKYLAGCGKTRVEPENSLVSTVRTDKKKACVEETSNSWTCSATSAPSSEFRWTIHCVLCVP